MDGSHLFLARCTLVTVLCLTGTFLQFDRSAGPNENTVEYDSSIAGQLVPIEETVIEVRSEDLEVRFEVVPATEGIDLGTPRAHPLRVHVTARYRLFNPSSENRSPLIAFPILHGLPEEYFKEIRLYYGNYKNDRLTTSTRRGIRCRVAVNGGVIPFEYVSFESLFEKERLRWAKGVNEWMSQWPAVAEAAGSGKALRTNAAIPEPHGANRGEAAGRFTDLVSKTVPDDTTRRLFDVILRQRRTHSKVEEWDLDTLSFLYTATHPGEEDNVARLQAQWGVDPLFLDPITSKLASPDLLRASAAPHYDLCRLKRLIDFLQYRPELPAGRETTIEVSYSHLADVDMYWRESGTGRFHPYTYQFQYILKTSPKWKTFGPIRLSLKIPCWTAYSISLPVRYNREKEGYDHFSYEIAGTDARDNLLIGLAAIDPWDKSGLVGNLPGVASLSAGPPYPVPLDLRANWEKYKADPKGPFADDLLYRMAQKLIAGEFKPEGVLYLAQEMQSSDPNPAALAIALMNRIPGSYPMRHFDGLLMARLYEFARKPLNAQNTQSLRRWLQDIRQREERFRLQPEPGDSKSDLEAKRKRLAKVAFMREKATLDRFIQLCDLYLSGVGEPFAPAPASQETRFKASIAEMEMEKRLAYLPRLDYSVKYRLQFNQKDFLRYLALYMLYRDVPESADLLRLLGWVRGNPSFFASGTNDRGMAADLAKWVDEEVKSRGLNLPGNYWSSSVKFPDWLCAD